MSWLVLLFRETWSVTRIGISTLPQRLGSSAVVVIGIAGVVGVLVALLAMGAGFEHVLKQTGSDDAVMILRAGAESEATSTLDLDTVAVISQAPQVLRDAEGRPVISAEQLLVASLPTRNSGLDASIAMRGVGESVWSLTHPVKIVAGCQNRGRPQIHAGIARVDRG
jgi:putative ABC transport system permease protein